MTRTIGAVTDEAAVGLPELDELAQAYDNIYIILSPPRCASTALARIFWEHEASRCYVHEPFDLCYHRQEPLARAIEALNDPLVIRPTGRNLIIKGMTFQVGEHFPTFARLTTRPILFLIRDPRLSIRSRMRKRRQGEQDPIYPQNESGWHDLEAQIEHCDAHGIPYAILETASFRNDPETLLPLLCQRLGLSFSPALLRWQPVEELAIGHLGSEQTHWYRRVLESRGIEPAVTPPPPVASFPAAFQPHVRECLAIYERLLTNGHLIAAPTSQNG